MDDACRLVTVAELHCLADCILSRCWRSQCSVSLELELTKTKTWVDHFRYFHIFGNMEVQHAVTALAALAQDSRLRIFRLLVRCAPDSLSAGAIADELQIPAATRSFHLQELVHSGLLKSSRDGRTINYSIEVCGVSKLMAFLTEDCCQGRPDLCVTSTAACCDSQPGTKNTKSNKNAKSTKKKKVPKVDS